MEVIEGTTEFKIIDATHKLLDEEGLNGTTTRKIAEKAGVSEVTIFRKFKTKDNLLKVVREFFYSSFMKEINEILNFDENTELNEYLLKIWNDCVFLSDENLNIIKLSLEEIRGVNEEKVLPKFSRAMINKLSDFFQSQIDKGAIRKLNTQIAALTVFSTIFESIVLWKICGETPENDIDSYVNDFLDIFIKGIAIN